MSHNPMMGCVRCGGGFVEGKQHVCPPLDWAEPTPMTGDDNQTEAEVRCVDCGHIQPDMGPAARCEECGRIDLAPYRPTKERR